MGDSTRSVCSLMTTPPQVAGSPPPIGGNRTIRTATRRRHADSRLLVLPNPHHCRHGGRRRDRRDRLRCPWAAAGPGRGAGRRQQGLAAVPVGGGGAWLRGPWAAAGPVGGGGAHGRRQGVAGHRGDTPSEARGAEGSRAVMPDTIVPKTQTTSPITAHFQCFSPRWSAFWALHHLKPPPHRLKQGECTTRGSDTPTTHHQGASCRAKPPLPHSKQPPGRRTPPNWIGNANLDRLLRSG